MKKFFKTIIPIIVIAVALILFLNWANKTEKYECKIEEIQSGIYARYQSTASSTPAYNYEIITVCVNGQLITYEGNVEFIFAENENKIKVTERPSTDHRWLKRYFAKYENGTVFAWSDGTTSWSSEGHTTAWKLAKLPEKEQ